MYQTKLKPFCCCFDQLKHCKLSPRHGRLLARGCATAALPTRARLAGTRRMVPALGHFWALKNPGTTAKDR